MSRNINIKDFTMRNGLPASKLVKLIITLQFTHVISQKEVIIVVSYPQDDLHQTGVAQATLSS